MRSAVLQLISKQSRSNHKGSGLVFRTKLLQLHKHVFSKCRTAWVTSAELNHTVLDQLRLLIQFLRD